MTVVILQQADVNAFMAAQEAVAAIKREFLWMRKESLLRRVLNSRVALADASEPPCACGTCLLARELLTVLNMET